MRSGVPPPPRSGGPSRQFDNLEATSLYCPRCRQAMPVRKRLLLVLPEGDKYEYFCARCGETCGNKLDKGPPPTVLI
jgi:hypothetical protein